MAVYFISADHRTLDLETVSRLGASVPGLGRDLLTDVPGLRGALVLATCNRVALLLDSVDAEEPDGLVGEVASMLARRAGVTDRLAPAAWVGAEAYRELFSTASGLESMVVGERQIAGQVRRAMRSAEQEGTLSPGLVRVVEHALVVSRRVAAETGVAGRGRSLAAVGVDLVTRQLPPLGQCRILLVGTGSYAGATVAVLRDRGAAGISVYSASDRAQAFARDHGLSAVAPGGLPQALAGADLVVTCRGLGAAVLTRELVERVGTQRAGRDGTASPLVLLDLSLARDVEEGVDEVPGVVHLDMRRIQTEIPDADAKDLADARAIVAQETQAFERLLGGRRMDGVIRGLRSQVGDIVAQEAARLRPRPDGAGRTDGSRAGGSGTASAGRPGSADDSAGHTAGHTAGHKAGPEAGPEPVVPLADAQQALRRLAARLMHHPTVAARRAGEDGQEEAFLAAVETVLGPEVVTGAVAASSLGGPPGGQEGRAADVTDDVTDDMTDDVERDAPPGGTLL